MSNARTSCRPPVAASRGAIVAIFFLAAINLSAAPKPSARRGHAASPAVIGMASVHLRVKSRQEARWIFHHLLGFNLAFETHGRGGHPVLYYKVNDYQYLRITPRWSGGNQPRLVSVGYRTRNARGLHARIVKAGFHPGPVHRLADGNLGFRMRDPEGHRLLFVQYLPGSRTGKLRGRLLSKRRLSPRLIHAGYIVRSPKTEDRLFLATLHFNHMWHGGMHAGETDWIDRRTADGPDWLEYMLRMPAHPSLRQRAVADHFSLGVYHMQAVYRELVARGWKPTQKPQIGRDGKWQLNLYTRAGSRIELMGPHPVEKPCCSPILPGSW